MGMTITEKILARASGRGAVEAGEIVRVKVDLVMGHDVTLPLSILEFKHMGAAGVYDREKVVAVCDHFAPASNNSAADRIKMVRDFAREQGLEHYFEPGCGQSGVCHAVLPEEGLILPGSVVLGADSHTTTYGALSAFPREWAVLTLRRPWRSARLGSGFPSRWNCTTGANSAGECQART